MTKAKEIAVLRAALEVAAVQFNDLAAVIDEHRSYDNAGFMRANATRCYEALAARDQSVTLAAHVKGSVERRVVKLLGGLRYHFRSVGS